MEVQRGQGRLDARRPCSSFVIEKGFQAMRGNRAIRRSLSRTARVLSNSCSVQSRSAFFETSLIRGMALRLLCRVSKLGEMRMPLTRNATSRRASRCRGGVAHRQMPSSTKDHDVASVLLTSLNARASIFRCLLRRSHEISHRSTWRPRPGLRRCLVLFAQHKKGMRQLHDINFSIDSSPGTWCSQQALSPAEARGSIQCRCSTLTVWKTANTA